MKKSTLYPKSAKDIKGKTAIAELKRAHLIITLLSFSIIPLLIIGTVDSVQFTPVLSALLVVFLVILGLASFFTIVALRK